MHEPVAYSVVTKASFLHLSEWRNCAEQVPEFRKTLCAHHDSGSNLVAGDASNEDAASMEHQVSLIPCAFYYTIVVYRDVNVCPRMYVSPTASEIRSTTTYQTLPNSHTKLS